jgi:exonuclease III
MMTDTNIDLNPVIEGDNQSSMNNSPIFKIATNNVRGLNETIKQLQIINYMKIQSINIMGLSETRLTSNTADLLYRNEKSYRAWWNCDSDQERSRNFTGVGLLLDSTYAKYVQKVQGYKGHVIHAHLFLRALYKLCIIQVYIHANDTDKQDKLDVYNYIKKVVNEANVKITESLLWETLMQTQTK